MRFRKVKSDGPSGVERLPDGGVSSRSPLAALLRAEGHPWASVRRPLSAERPLFGSSAQFHG